MGTPPSHQPPPPPLPPPPGHPLAHKPSDPHQSPNNTVTAEPALYAQPRSITEGSSHQHPSPSAGPASGSLSTPGSSTTHGGGAPSLSSHGSSIGGPAHSTPHSSHSQNHTQPQQHSERKHPTHHPPPHGSHSQLPSSSGSITNTAATPSSVSTLVGSGNPTSPLHHPEHPIQVRVLQQSHGGSSDANAKPGAAGLSRSQTEKGPAQAKGGSRSPSEGGSSGKEQSAGGDTCTPTPPLPASQSAPPPPPPPGSSPPFPPLLNQGGGAGGGGGGNHSHSHHAMMMPNSHHHHQGYTWRRNAPPADRPLVSSAESGGAQSHAQQQQGQQPGQGHLSSAAPSSASSGKPGGVSKGSGGKKNLTLVPKHPEQQKQQQQTEHSSRGSGGASAKSGLPGPPPPSREAADPHHQHAGVKVLTGPDRMVRGVEEQKKNDLLLSHTHVEDQKGGGMSSSSSSASAGSSKSNATAVHHPTMPQHAHPTRPPPHPKTAAAPFPRSSPAVEDASLQQPALQPPPQPPPGPVPLGDAAASPTILGSSHPSASASALRSASPLRSPNSRLLAEPDSQQPPESQQKGTEKETPGASQPASLSLEHQHANSSSSSRGTPPIPPHAATAQSQKTGGPKQPQQQGVASKQAGVESGGSALVSTHQQNPNPKAAGVLTVNQTRDGVRVLAAPSGPRLVPKAAPGVPPLVVPQQQQQSVPAQAPSPLKSPPAASLGTSTVLLQHQQKCCTKCGTAYPEHVQNALTVFAANAERRRQQEDEPAVFSYRSPSPSVTPSVMNVEVEPSEYSIGRTRREREKLGGKLGPGKRKKRAAPIPSLPSGGTLKKREEEKDPDCPIAALCNSASARSLLSSCAASCGTTCKPPLLDRLTKTENHSDAESKSSARDRKPLPTAISIRSMKAKEVEIPSGEAAKESASSGFSLNFLKMHQEDPSAEYFDVTKNSMAAPLQRRTLKKEKGKEEGGKSVSSVQGEKGGSQPSTSADQEAVVQGSETAAGKVMGGQTGAEALEGPALGEKTKDPPGGEVRQHKPEAPSGSPKKKVEGRAVRRKLVERLGPRQVLLLSGGGAVGVIGAFVLVQGLQGVVTLSSRLFRGWGR
uniref:Uncharacterized protein n=1 Tax=Chromera velia CCMP2878 TaxID=1169474 RepID=A0A0G4GB40_9ALVE|eukprot:Cvel_21101.t1-p1 / transcript=Cvel_21101.t1 / gene=Cvel_21101 / organism=Chromera_velia_CCMP2878 / gene_product=hypothetical protein / transcript_product=hypothetical protein / location=Cvel_scaffold1951:26364-29648(+) / protein_length=1095 / sequence_SO=supercontig / SO=protein_coding / is_pseudo=false